MWRHLIAGIAVMAIAGAAQAQWVETRTGIHPGRVWVQTTLDGFDATTIRSRSQDGPGGIGTTAGFGRGPDGFGTSSGYVVRGSDGQVFGGTMSIVTGPGGAAVGGSDASGPYHIETGSRAGFDRGGPFANGHTFAPSMPGFPAIGRSTAHTYPYPQR